VSGVVLHVHDQTTAIPSMSSGFVSVCILCFVIHSHFYRYVVSALM